MNCGAQSSDEVLPLCLLNLNWEHSVDPQDSILSSQPPASLAVQISGFMDDPLNSMHANHMLQFPNDLGFVERAARYSFNGGNFGARPYQFGIQEAGKLSRAPNIKFHGLRRAQHRVVRRQVGGRERLAAAERITSVTDLASARGESNAKKRKAAPKCKGKRMVKCKKPKSGRSTANEKDGCMPKEEEADVKNPDPHKDYIHVRARRGQATDSHSLAERVRREKISQRMMLLQALVPGCSKITGKALVLDEIINYVQSLQRQVEFLSMKLATVDPLGLTSA
ncbi:hypothetical protein HPP92_002812 [Vanilla planifolia]|uniref:BHLH domain-containing protein n=1 Tax=Vanilla planifolia TaxID=51239 RepID=A0A835S966_VANPL|nr:hypothetical protein HPP92_002812 [Vanilla planifolia]